MAKKNNTLSALYSTIAVMLLLLLGLAYWAATNYYGAKTKIELDRQQDLIREGQQNQKTR